MKSTLPRQGAAVIGLVAAGSALAAGHLVAGLGAGKSPLISVGDAAIDLTPQPVKEFAIAAFGTGDKTALVIGMLLVIAVLAGLAGLLSRRRWQPGAIVIAGVGSLGLAAGVSSGDVVPPLVSIAAGVGVFRWLHHLAAGSDATTEVATTGLDRRRFLVTTGLVALGAGAAGVAGGLLHRGSGAVSASQAAVRAWLPRMLPAIPAGADFVSSGTPAYLTANRDFYRIDTALVVPQLRAEDWRLRLHGTVDRELTLSFEDLLRERMETRVITLACVSNEVGGDLISNAAFTGVPVRDLLLRAGIRPGAQQLITTSKDGFFTGTPLDVLMEPDRGALLAFGMNGEPLPVEHGFPVRMVVPGLYGYVSATKWLTDAEVTTFDRTHYWEQRGWAKFGPIKTQSRIDRPRQHSSVAAGPVTIAGIAWAQHTGIDRVEVRVDGGPWLATQAATDVSRDTWRMWRTTVELPPGNHTIESRATDHTGTPQPEHRQGTLPNGATGYHTVPFTCE